MFARNVASLSSRCSAALALKHAGSARHRTAQAQVRRWFMSSHPRHATPPPMLKASNLSTQEYHQLSDTTMDTLLESLETLLDDIGDPDHEIEYSSGVLTLKLGDKGTYVINKQPPNKQIWLSSPFSGPKRYDYDAASKGWFYSRDGVSLGDLLETELSEALGSAIELKLTSTVDSNVKS